MRKRAAILLLALPLLAFSLPASKAEDVGLSVDRKEQMVAVMMIQTPFNSLRRDFENAVMQAIID